MILYKYIFKDIVKVQTVCFAVLFTVFLCQSVIKLLGKASAGVVPVDIVSELVLYSMPSVGFILLPMTLYIGIIVSLSRMSSDSEMVVMKSIGVSGSSFMKISLIIALFTSIVTAVNCLYLMPEATLKQKELSNSTQNNPMYLPIESGKFTDFGDYTIYVHSVEGASRQKVLGQIFIIKNVSRVMINNKDTVFLT
ncbi:MAG: LptF/LptG family permease, partial [Succinivibrio sp.]